MASAENLVGSYRRRAHLFALLDIRRFLFFSKSLTIGEVVGTLRTQISNRDNPTFKVRCFGADCGQALKKIVSPKLPTSNGLQYATLQNAVVL